MDICLNNIIDYLRWSLVHTKKNRVLNNKKNFKIKLTKSTISRRAIPLKYFENMLWIQLELLKIHIKSVKISRFSPKYWAIFSFLSQVCCLVTPIESFVLKYFQNILAGSAFSSRLIMIYSSHYSYSFFSLRKDHIHNSYI